MQDQVPPDTPSSDPLKLPEHVLDALPGVLFVVGADGVTEFCGSAVIDVMGFSAAEFVATPGLWWQCLHPEDVRRITGLQRHRKHMQGRAGVLGPAFFERLFARKNLDQTDADLIDSESLGRRGTA